MKDTAEILWMSPQRRIAKKIVGEECCKCRHVVPHPRPVGAFPCTCPKCGHEVCGDCKVLIEETFVRK